MESSAWGMITCEKIDRMASWVGSNVASAFFASLERCSCITLSVDDDFDSFDSFIDRPLLLTDPPPPPPMIPVLCLLRRLISTPLFWAFGRRDDHVLV